MGTITEILEQIGIPSAYDHFAEGESPEPPFICYLSPNDNNFAADGVAYYEISRVRIELYTDLKDPETEKAVTTVLKAHGIFYTRTEVWIEEEKLYEVTFECPVYRPCSKKQDFAVYALALVSNIHQGSYSLTPYRCHHHILQKV